MAHWAELDKNNTVIRVLVTDNNDPNGDEGHKWLVDNLGGTWVQTSYNTQGGVHLLGGTPLRKNYAGIGFTYDSKRDAFVAPKPFDSWILDEETCLWEAPVKYPTDGKKYTWNETTVSWELVETEEN